MSLKLDMVYLTSLLKEKVANYIYSARKSFCNRYWTVQLSHDADGWIQSSMHGVILIN